MFGIVPGLWGGGLPDPHDNSFANVALLFHFDGANNANSIGDSSSHGFGVNVGANTVTTSDQIKFGNASVLCNNPSTVKQTGSLTVNDNAAFTLGTSDFTVEFFAYFLDSGTARWLCGQSDAGVSNANTSLALQRTTGNKIRALTCNGANVLCDISSANTAASNAWHYIAFTRQGANFTLFLNAITENSASSNLAVNDSTFTFGIGCVSSAANELYGYMDEFRLTVGVARDVANIGVPTSAFPNA